MVSKLKKKLNKKGFTLAELLIVVAIIAVLVAVSIPVFGGQLQKAKYAVDLANVRAAYAEEVANAMLNSSYDADGNITISKAKINDTNSVVKNGSSVEFTDGTSITVELGSNKDTITVDSNVKFSD